MRYDAAVIRRISLGFLYLAVAATTRLVSACPLCADNLATDVYGKDPTRLGRGFFWSIIFMMALPFVTVATVAARILIAKRRAARREASEPSPNDAAIPSGAAGVLPDAAS